MKKNLAIQWAALSAILVSISGASAARAGEFEVGASFGFGTGTNHGHAGVQGHARASADLHESIELVGEGAVGHTVPGERLNSLNLDARSKKEGFGYDVGYRHEFDAHTHRNALHSGLGIRAAETFSSVGVIVGEHSDEDYNNKGIETGFLLINESEIAGGDVSFSVMGEIASLRDMSGEGPMPGLYRTQQSKDKGKFRVFGFKLKKKSSRENMSYFGEVKITSRSYKSLQYGMGHVTSIQNGGNTNVGVRAGIVMGFGSHSAK